ncbi:uncharacterized protein [Cherax quadricarinatus]|uniref:uncharacterized protein isoform X2 n=2 Tax=Cherax quadricarinatus TaxID=27406 RepID=UPI00387E7E42
MWRAVLSVTLLLAAVPSARLLNNLPEFSLEDAVKDILADDLNTTWAREEKVRLGYSKDILKDALDENNVKKNTEDLIKSIWEERKTAGKGSLRVERNTEASMEEICSCFQGNGDSCSNGSKIYGPFVRNGVCHGGNMWRKRRRGADRSDTEYEPQLSQSLCQGDQLLVFASSGTEPWLMVGHTPVLYICPGSLSSSLEHLSIFKVGEVKVSPGALQPRNTSLVINVSEIEKTFILPEGAFSFQTIDPSNNKFSIDYQDINAPAEMQLIIEQAAEVMYEPRSIVAPRIFLSMKSVRIIRFCSRAIIPYIQPEASFLEVKLTDILVVETQAINIGDFKAINIKELTLKEASVDVASDGGGEVIFEGIENAVLEGAAMALSPSVSLILNNVNINFAGHRAIFNYNTSVAPLLKVHLQNLTISTLASAAFCLDVASAFLDNVMAADGDEIFACLQTGLLMSDDEWPGMVTCSGHHHYHNSALCGDPRCESCLSDPPSTSTPVVDVAAPTSSSFTTTSHPTYNSTTEASLLGTSTSEEKNETELTHEAIPYWGMDELPMYAVILAIIAGIICILLITFFTYKVFKHSQHGKYKLPQLAPSHTFHKTIITAENLHASRSQHSEAAADMYVTYSTSEATKDRQALPTVSNKPPDFYKLPANAHMPLVNTSRSSEDSN